MQQNLIYKIFVSLLWCMTGTVLCIITWGLNKGFDFTDEGFNMLSFMKNQENDWNFLPVYPLIGKMAVAFKPGILFFRIFRLILLLISSFVFSFGFTAWCRSTINSSLHFSFNFFYPVIFLSTLMSYAFSYQILSYNSLTLFLIQIVTGLFFLTTESSWEDKRFRVKQIIIFFFTGFFIGLLLLVKYPSAIILTLVLIVLFTIEVYSKQNKINLVLLYSCATFSGILFFALLLGVFFQSPLTIIAGMIKGKEYLPAHSLPFLIHLYRDNLYTEFLKIILYHKIMIACPLLLWLMLKFSYPKFFFIAAIIPLFAFIVKDVVENEYYGAGMSHMYVASAIYRLIALFCVILIMLNLIDRSTRNLWALVILNAKSFLSGLFLLLLIPFLCSFGTANVPSIHITQFVFSWVVIFIFLLYIYFSKFPFSNYLFLIITVLLMLNVSSQIIYGYVFSPYRVNAPLTQQQFNVPDLPVDNTMLFDYETSIFLKNSVEKLKSRHALIKGQPIISIYNYPGLTYLLGGYSPGNAWYFDSGYENYYNSNYFFDYNKSNCFFLVNSKMKNLDRTVIMIEQNFTVPDAFIQCLHQKGIQFPEKYYKADSVKIPGEKRNLYFYLPLQTDSLQ